MLSVNVVFYFGKFKWCKDWKTGWHFFTWQVRENESNVKKQLSLLKTKIETVEERFSIGEIENDLYTKFKMKYNEDQKDLESNLLNSTISSSNLQIAIDKALKILSILIDI